MLLSFVVSPAMTIAGFTKLAFVITRNDALADVMENLILFLSLLLLIRLFLDALNFIRKLIKLFCGVGIFRRRPTHETPIPTTRPPPFRHAAAACAEPVVNCNCPLISHGALPTDNMQRLYSPQSNEGDDLANATADNSRLMNGTPSTENTQEVLFSPAQQPIDTNPMIVFTNTNSNTTPMIVFTSASALPAGVINFCPIIRCVPPRDTTATAPEGVPPPPQGDWVWDGCSHLYWSAELYMFYQPESRTFYDSRSGCWYEPRTDQWASRD